MHYPDNFLLLPKLFNHAHFVILTVYGIVASGIVIKKIEGLQGGEKIPTFSAAGSVLKKYFSILIAWLLSYGVCVFTIEKLLGLFKASMVIQFSLALALSIVMQALFAFLFPALLIQPRGFWKDLGSGLSFAAKNIFFTSLLVALPVTLVVVLSFVKAFSAFFVRVSPDSVFWILLGGIVVTWIVDAMVTVSTTLFYVKARTQK